MIKRTSRKGLIFSLFLILVGCGQKGPLFLPDEAPQNQRESVMIEKADAADAIETD